MIEKKVPARKFFIDNLRWLCILLLVPFHCAMAWNSWGEGNYISIGSNVWLSSFIIMISPWYMPLLFVLAGVSAKYSIEARGMKQFRYERVKKLLLPLLTGMLTVVAVMTYFADRFNYGYQGSFLSHYGVFFTKFTDLTGYDGGWTPAHLWFLLYLFLISLIALLVIRLQKRFCPDFRCPKLNTVSLFLLMLFPIIMKPILNFTGKSIGSDLALFIIGYYVISDDDIMEKIVELRWITLFVMLVTDIADTYQFLFMTNANTILNSVTMEVTSWFGILTLLGWGKKCFNQNNKVFRYLSSHSFTFYIFHFMWIVIFQSWVVSWTESLAIRYVVPIILAYAMTFVTGEVISRIPGVRFLYGVKPRK